MADNAAGLARADGPGPGEGESALRLKVRRVVESRGFTNLILAVIIANAALLGLDTDVRMHARFAALFATLDALVTFIFVMELGLKLYARGFAFFRGAWNCFDLAVVLISLMPDAGAFAVLRVLRVFRVFRLFSLLPALRRVVDALFKAGHVSQLKLPGLSEKRQAVFPGGVMILLAAFEALGIERMRVSEGALREGVLYDLLGRLRHDDVRGRAVANLAGRLGVDTMQAARVERTALGALGQVAQSWNLDSESARLWLRWAAQLHEVGLAVSHTSYHKHGAYILENADLQGFSRQEQLLLAALVRAHRRKFPAPLFKKLSGGRTTAATRLAALLRLAVALHRNRNSAPLPRLELKAKEESLQLKFPDEWLNQHPLTRADLEQEAEFLKAAAIKLDIG